MAASRHNTRLKLVEVDGREERELYSADKLDEIREFIELKQGNHDT